MEGTRVRLCLTLALVAATAASATAVAQTTPAPARGELLYTTHCIACHTTQVHWRAGKVVTDWASLLAQVRRWQDTAALQWSDADITEVARHLNATIYRFPSATAALR